MKKIEKIDADLPPANELMKLIMLTSIIAWKFELFEKDIKKWLKNFKGEVYDLEYERQIALWLLSNFVYYNESEVRHLCKTLYRDFIHDILITESSSKKDIDTKIVESLGKSRFYHLGRPSESGAFISYLFRQANNIPISKFISNPDNVPSEVDTIVFIDDVTLSDGKTSQAFIYLNEMIKNHFSGKNIKLLTLIATEKSKTYLKSLGIKVISCINFDHKNKCFNEDSNIFRNFPSHRENAKKFAEHYGKQIKPFLPLGYNDGQYTFGFFYNAPDNTIPIFWAENNDWYPVIKRYDKNYGRTKYIELERFV